MIAAIATGHVDLSDFLLLLAAILFFVQTLIAVVGKGDPLRGALLPLGLTFLAVGFLVL